MSNTTLRLDAHQERALKRARSSLWGRFDGTLEDHYRNYAERRAGKLIHRSIYVLIGLFLLVVTPVALFATYTNLTTWLQFCVYPITGSLILLLLAIKNGFPERWVPTLIGLVLMTSLAGTLLGAIHMAGTFLGQVAAFETVYVLIIGYSILRLPPTRTLFWCLGSLIVALLTAMVAGWEVQPVSLLLFYGFPLLVCTLNGYMLDASARISYANTLLLNRESNRLRQWRDNADREAERQRLLNDFMAHIAGNPTVSTLLDQVLDYLITHTAAIAGAGYRLEDELLHRKAARGLNTEALERHTLSRDSLLGGALASGPGITVRHQVPTGYLDLETGQNRIQPASVLMVPVWQGEQPLGIIELAALETFDDATRATIESLVSPLAYALMAAAGREDYIRRHRRAAS